MKNMTYLLLLFLGLMSCQTNDEIETTQEEEEEMITAKVDELIFGLYYGRCAGDCAHLFQIIDGQLFRDNIERFEGLERGVFSAEPVADEDYQLAVPLAASIPDALLDSRETKFGSPNVVDQGTLIVSAVRDGVTLGPWSLDPFTDNLPEELKEFQLEMKGIIDTLIN